MPKTSMQLSEASHVMEQNETNEVDSLILKRTLIQSDLDRFVKWFIDNRESASTSVLKIRLRDFEKIKDEFHAIQRELEALFIGTPEEHLTIRSEFENAFYNTFGEIDDLINSSTNHNIHHNFDNIESNSVVRLPPIDIKPFSSEYTEWLSFFNTFTSLVDKNPRYANKDVDKLHQLRNALRGEAFDAIKTLPIVEQNYNVAIQTLKDMFENERIIIQHHVNNILNLPQVSRDSARSLRNFLNVVNINIESLKSLGVNVDT